METFSKVLYERPETDSPCDAWIIVEIAEFTLLLVPSAVDNNTLSVVVAKNFEGGDVYYQAENYWMNEDEEAAVAAHHAFLPDDFTFLLGYRDGMPWLKWILATRRIRAGVDLPPDRVRAAS